jgi:signal transduction histidine kinase
MARGVAARRRAAGTARRAAARARLIPDAGRTQPSPRHRRALPVDKRHRPGPAPGLPAQPVRAILIPACAGLLTLAVTSIGAPPAVVAVGVAALAFAVQRTARQRAARAVSRLEAQQLRALKLREEQLANTAHELRTPLTAVTTAVELLRDGYAQSKDDWHVFLDQASVAARHMAFLINDVVDLAAIDCGRISLHVREQRVQELVFDVAQVMQLTAQQRHVELRIEEPRESLVVVADRGRFLQIVFNLVGNAIKFSEPGALVRLVTEVEADSVRFEVHDDGPGVDVDSRTRLFTRFGRAHDRTQPGVAGTGLGLHVCKLLAERMGGAIGFRPGTVRGSVFWFTLPRSNAGASLAPATTPRAPVDDVRAVAKLETAPA